MVPGVAGMILLLIFLPRIGGVVLCCLFSNSSLLALGFPTGVSTINLEDRIRYFVDDGYDLTWHFGQFWSIASLEKALWLRRY